MNNLGQTETEIGTVTFVMNAGNFEIRTHKKAFTVPEGAIKETYGKFFYTLSENTSSGFRTDIEIEIPADVMKQMEKHIEEGKLSKDCLGRIVTTQGNVYFWIGREGQIIAKRIGKTIETNTIYTIEGKRVLFVPGLELDSVFLEVPEVVEYGLKKFEDVKRSRAFCLVYAGQSLLTGKHYYKFNYDVTQEQFSRVKGQLEFFEPGDFGSLEGWVTSKPELAEEYLKIRKNRIEDRKEEIEKQKAQAVKANEKLIKNLLKV